MMTAVKQKFVDRRASLRKAQHKFRKSRRAELDYAKKLRSIAQQVGVIVKGFTTKEGVVFDKDALMRALEKYADMITPWARAVASRMLDDIKRRDEAMWIEMGNEIGRNLREEIEHAHTGEAMRKALDDQVALITSLPREAGRRVHDLTLKALVESGRAKEIAEEILRTGEVTKSRATLIARTETGRVASELLKVRAESAGVTHYIWHTSHDADVRASHKKMDGKVFEFNNPPEVEPGHRYHPGAFPNCRCWAEPIVPETD